MVNQISIWSVIEKYSGKKNHQIVINKKEGSNEVELIVYKFLSFNVFGLVIGRRVEVVKNIIKVSDYTILGEAVNKLFADDRYVDILSYMKFAEKGFAENAVGNFKDDIMYCVSMMSSESNELLDHIVKFFYHGKPLDKAAIAAEAGDELWYKMNALRLLGISFSDVIKANVIKLNVRYPNGRKDKNIIKDIQKENKMIESFLSGETIDNDLLKT